MRKLNLMGIVLAACAMFAVATPAAASPRSVGPPGLFDLLAAPTTNDLLRTVAVLSLIAPADDAAVAATAPKRASGDEPGEATISLAVLDRFGIASSLAPLEVGALDNGIPASA